MCNLKFCNLCFWKKEEGKKVTALLEYYDDYDVVNLLKLFLNITIIILTY